MSKHTPGPWTPARAKYPVDGEFDFAIGAIVDGRMVVIAETFGRAAETIRPPVEFNARLIAAAPEMLTVLQRLFDCGYTTSKDHDMVRDVIRLAGGDLPE